MQQNYYIRYLFLTIVIVKLVSKNKGRILRLAVLKFIKKNIKTSLTFFGLLFLLNSCFGEVNYSQLDGIRYELSLIPNQNSDSYIKAKQKLNKLVTQNKLDYSNEKRLEDCLRLINEQKYDCAIYELKELIKLNYNQQFCYELLGDISQKYNTLEDFKRAIFYYKKALEINQLNYNCLIKISLIYINFKKNIKAIEFLTKIALNSDNNEILDKTKEIVSNKIIPQNRFEANNLYELLGIINYRQQNLSQAYIDFHKALALNNHDIFLKYFLGDLYALNHENEKALKMYQSIIDENNDTQIKLSKAKILNQMNDKNTAKSVYLNVLNEFPTSNQAKYGFYKAFENSNEIEILKQLNKNIPNYSPKEEDFINFAKFLEEMGENEAARRFYNCIKIKEQKNEENKKIIKKEEVIKSNKDAKKENISQKTKEIQTKNKSNLQKEATPKKTVANKPKKEEAQSKAQEKLQKKETQQIAKPIIQEQEQISEKAIELERKNFSSKHPKQYQELNKKLQEYLSNKTKTPEIYIAIANTYKQMQMPSAAIKYFNYAKKLNPTNSDIYYNIGLCYLELNKTEISKQYLTKAINLDNENKKAINLLAFVEQKIITNIINATYSKFQAKDYLGAYELIDSGIKKYPKNAQLYYYRALALEPINRNSASINDLQTAINLNPGYYMAYYKLAKLYEKINDEKSALVSYERFLSSEPEEKDLVNEVQKKVIDLGKKYY